MGASLINVQRKIILLELSVSTAMQGGEVKYRTDHTCKKINTYNRDSSRLLLGLIWHLTGTERERRKL